MSPLPLLALGFLAAAPLEVRVLERHAPARVKLEAKAFSCDGKPLQGPLEAAAGQRDVEAAGAHCLELVAEGGVTLTVKDLTRRFPGAVRVSLQGGLLRLINVVDVEDYLPSVVHAEADGSPPAALEAQAVVSRTFAVTGQQRHARAGHHLCDLAHCQVYRGLEASPEAAAAVKATAGKVLLVGGVALKPAFFHASCGGHTSRAADVFGEEGAGSAVSDVEGNAARCTSPDFAWTFEVERTELARALHARGGGAAVEPLRRDAAGRLVELRSFGTRYSGTEWSSRVGRAFGWQALRSMKFTTTETDTTLRFSGTGSGHGVGLCQLGARALAKQGVDALTILKRYFPESQVRVP